MIAEIESFLKESAWIAALVLLVIAVFRDSLKTLLTKAVGAIGTAIYTRLAGSRLFRKRALKKYRAGLVKATERIVIPFRPNRPLILDDIYVSLRLGADGSEKPKTAGEILSAHPRLVVTGPPGGGKSMLLRHLAANHTRPSRERVSAATIPVLLELHRLARPAKGGTEIEHYIVDAFERYGFPKANKFVASALEKGWLLLLLDGFDEVPTAERPETAARLRDFLESIADCPVVITCRTAVYRNEFDAVTGYQAELEPFEDQQIETFLSAWSDPMPAEKSPAQLMAALREQPQLLTAARNPLLLTIITHLYSDNPTYALPHSRAEFYRQAAAILLEQWQEHLHHNTFDGAEKKTVLAAMALHMQETEGMEAADRRTISREDAVAQVAKVLPNLGRSEDQAAEMILEIVERSGLLLPVDGGSRYAFAHLTFQEYFAAEALLNHPQDLLRRFGEDPDGWREVIILWCGLVGDSTATIEQVHRIDSAVSLACIAEANSVDSATATRILGPAIEKVIQGESNEHLERAIGAVAADIRPRGRTVLDSLVRALEEAEDSSGLESIAVALSASNQPRAAEAIVNQLSKDPNLALSVVRLGDLAVPGLEAFALRGESRLAIGCLAEIGTPSAGVALAEIMTRRGTNCHAAAWGLAKTVGNPLVAQELSKFVKDRQSLVRSHFDWVWRPFAGSTEVGVPELIGVAVEMLLDSAPEDIVASPDPRIAIALCSREPCPLERPLKQEQSTEHLIETVNAAADEITYQFVRGVLYARAKDGVRRPEVRHMAFTGKKALPDYKTFLQAACEDVGFSQRPRIREFRTPEPVETESIRQEKLDTISTALIDTFRDPIWKALVQGLPPSLRRGFLLRMTRPGKVNRETWKAVATDTSYSFKRSGWYGLVLAVALGVSGIAFFQGISITVADPGSASSFLALLACGSILASWRWQRQASFDKAILGVDPDTLAISLLGPILLLILADEIRDRLKGEGSGILDLYPIAVAGFLPSLCWLGIEALGGPFFTCLLLLLALLAATITLSGIGVLLEHRRRMPLAGFFNGEPKHDVAPFQPYSELRHPLIPEPQVELTE
ncbi:MAG TPA: NACHT domain-containing protein [Solirubrobacterales bacterium]|nr:NACHT domain-containing protein [Solirubrobacterales bacterium]